MSSNIPADLRYTDEHEWVAVTGPTTVRVGITDFAQDALNEIVFVSLPEVGRSVAPGDSFAEVESTKSFSEIYAPVAGTISAVNADLDGEPGLVNTAPYAGGWLVDIEVPAGTDLDDLLSGLLDAAGYRGVTEG